MSEESLQPKLTEKALHDTILIRAALDNGDQQAYAELLDRYRDSLYSMMLRMVGHEDDADDLTIEAFAKAFKRLDQYQNNFAFSTWLFKIASNNCIDFIRKKKMNTFSLDTTFTNDDGSVFTIDFPSSNHTPEEELVKKQKLKMLRDIVVHLKPHYKQLIEMKYFDELSIEEISIKMDLSIGTVKTQLFRAREFLANVLKNSGHKM